MTWLYLDELFPEHPKVARAGGDAAWLYVCALGWVQRNLTGGLIPCAKVPTLSDRRNALKLADRLVECGLWDRVGDDFSVHNYAVRNPTAERKRQARKERATNAANARWEKKKDATSMPQASAEHATTIALACSDDASLASAGARPGTPLPLPCHPNLDTSSSPNLGVAPAVAEEEIRPGDQALAKGIAASVAERRLARSQGEVRNRSGWLQATAQQVLKDHASDIATLRSRGFSVAQVVAALDPDGGRLCCGSNPAYTHRPGCPDAPPPEPPAAQWEKPVNGSGVAAARAAMNGSASG